MRYFWLMAAAVLTSCASDQVVRYVGPSGAYGSGSIAMNGTLGDGRLIISNKGETCAGTFPSWSALTVIFPVQCTGGATGTVTLTRPAEGRLTAQGSMLLSTGETRQIIYGDATGQWRAL